MKETILIVVVAVACGVGGYYLGDSTAPPAHPEEREKLTLEKRAAAKRLRDMRSMAAGPKKPSAPFAPKTMRRPGTASRPGKPQPKKAGTKPMTTSAPKR
ncbi:MAG: hypothetical protein JXQ73_24795 [Phycisphaerae bacterium]|nr:hypothetical protein [Phycisphaerae bacterium]